MQFLIVYVDCLRTTLRFQRLHASVPSTAGISSVADVLRANACLSPYRVFCIPQQLEDGSTAGTIRHSVRVVSVL